MLSRGGTYHCLDDWMEHFPPAQDVLATMRAASFRETRRVPLNARAAALFVGGAEKTNCGIAT